MSTTSLFKSKFSPKKASARKTITISPLQMDASERAREFGLDYNDAYMILSDQLIRFDPESGEWFIDSDIQKAKIRQDEPQTASTNKEIFKLQKGNQQLQEENNLLRVKNELLLDMIAEVYSEMKLEHEERKN